MWLALGMELIAARILCLNKTVKGSEDDKTPLCNSECSEESYTNDRSAFGMGDFIPICVNMACIRFFALGQNDKIKACVLG